MVRRSCSNTTDTRLPFLSSFSKRSDSANCSSTSRSWLQLGWRCFMQAQAPWLAAQPGWERVRISHATDDTFGQNSSQLRSTHHHLQRCSTPADRLEDPLDPVTQGWDWTWHSFHGRHWDPILNILAPVSSLCKDCILDARGVALEVFHLNLNLTEAERLLETQPASLHLV